MTSASSARSVGFRVEPSPGPEAHPAMLRLAALDAAAPTPLGHPHARWLAPGFLAGVLHPEDREAALSLLRVAAEDGGTRGAEVRLGAADGRWVHARLTVHALGVAGGTVLCGTLAWHEEAEEGTERLRTLGELAAVLAHEVRNPLGAITMALASARRVLRPAPEHAFLFDVIGEETGRLERLVVDLLDVARPHRPELRPQPLDGVVEAAVGAALRGQPGSERVAVTVEVDPGLPPVPLDAQLLHLALVNVLVNALQAMPEGGALRVSAVQEGGRARLRVRDTGPGIPPEHLARVFEPFFTTRSLGTGLGLAIVRRILQSHGGTVEVEASGAPGTTMLLSLPLAPPSAASAA